MKNVMIVNGSIQYVRMFELLGFKVVGNLTDADLVCFTGGADVTPSLYGQEPHPTTSNSLARDEVETVIYKDAKAANIPMVGICRGGQFLHVMNGGSLFQHVDGHATGKPHKLVDVQLNQSFLVTSTHHQMMADVGVGIVVAIASQSNKVEWCKGDNPVELEHEHDIEVMWHEDTKCLCFQPHPEFPHVIEGAESTYSYFKNLLEMYYAED